MSLDQGGGRRFEPEKRAVILDGSRVVKYTALIVAPRLARS